MSSIPHRSLTEAEFLVWEETQDKRHEYHHGEIFAMAGGTASHAKLIVKLSSSLDQQASGTKCVVYSGELQIQWAA